MIIKERKTPIEILRLEALLRRIPKNHPKIHHIEESLKKRKAGYQGEVSLNYFLDYLPDDEYLIINNLRLYDGKRYFQIDCVILSQAFILILEVKNLLGTLVFDTEFNQMIRIINDKEEAFPDPILQVERQKENLKNWISLQGIPALPIETLVLISNPHTIIKTPTQSGQLSRKVIHSANLPKKVEYLNKKYNQEKISMKELKKLSRLFLRKHELQYSNLLEHYLILENELLTGVHCMNCFSLKMKRNYGSWICTICGYKSKDAHVASLRDYALLIRPIVTNQKARRFLELESITIASRILSSMKIQHLGNFKGRIYELHSLLE
ncbi:nuclease-related domain-containing protein [Bacillus pinisoli]|uniref:nuclease-related domain-containing protein n=1 Tax=Bacillus pinisoli TaxID=2901866 RepID=UPI001FF1735A|nr:nuclease-related domain-containing protein [Bacillus pinisoli]